ncbi:MAG: hypothetical protein HFG41_11210 [Coprococcus sp.]|nr:hypothetical protein [Coprococcus sp.]
MNISVRKLSTLCKKDIIDYFKNPALVVCSLLPILFVLLYKYIDFSIQEGDRNTAALMQGTLINSCMCALMIPSTMIAEEKEKFTLRTLMLSNVNAMEFFWAKILVAGVITIVGNVVVFMISAESISYLPAYLLTSVFGNSCVVMLGADMGMACRDQASCSVLQIPVMLLFLLPVMLSGAAKFMLSLGKITPYGAMLRLYHGLTAGSVGAEKMAVSAAVILVWLIISSILFAYLYRVKGTDN